MSLLKVATVFAAALLCITLTIAQPIPFPDMIPSSSFHLQMVDTIVRQGLRNAGSAADIWVEDFGIDYFTKLGLQGVTTQAIPIRSWQVNSSGLKVTSSSGTRSFSIFPHLFVDWSDTIVGECVVYDSTTALSALTDKIVIVNHKLDLFAPAAYAPRVVHTYDPDGSIDKTIHPQPIPHRSDAAGALVGKILTAKPKAVICVLSNFYDTDRVWGLYSRTDSIYSVPCFWMGRNAGQALGSILSADAQAKVSVEFDTKDRPVVTRNVYGVLRGNSSQSIVFNSHHDGQFYGATQDAAGITLVAALAAYWSRVPQSMRPFNMVFLWDAAHMKESIGSEFFVKNTPEIIDRTLVAFTLETPSLEGRILNGNLVTLNRPEPRWFYTSDTLGLQTSLYESVQKEDLRRTYVAPPTLTGMSPIGDSHAFYNAGIPVVAHLSTPIWYMSAADSTDKIDTASMNRITRAVIRMVWNLPNITGIPDFSERGLEVFPNPATTSATVRGLPADYCGSYHLINLAGVTVKHEVFCASSCLEVNVTDLPRGMYLIILMNNRNGSHAVQRLVVE